MSKKLLFNVSLLMGLCFFTQIAVAQKVSSHSSGNLAVYADKGNQQGAETPLAIMSLDPILAMGEVAESESATKARDITDLYKKINSIYTLPYMKKSAAALSGLKKIDLQETVQGRIVDAETGEPLPGVNIAVKGTLRGTTTDSDGDFEISVDNLGVVLVFSFIGYETQEIALQGNQTVNVNLKSSVSSLDDLVVIGFGTASRREIVSSISSVDSKKLTQVYANSLDKALQGQAAGVRISSVGGNLGAPVEARIRGITSVNASSQPLYVVDGVPMISASIGSDMSGTVYEGGLNPLLNLDLNTIESVEILKDAAAAAIYGSRGANGVILITTKSGQSEKSIVNVRYSTGFTSPLKLIDMLSGPQYIEMYNYREGLLGTPGELNPADYPNNNWIDLVTQTGRTSNYMVDVSGGTAQTRFFVSGGFRDNQGYIRRNTLQQYNLTAKIDHDFNDRLHIGLKLSPSQSEGIRVPTNNLITSPFSLGYLTAPVVPQFLADGEINTGNFALSPLPGNKFSPFNGTPYGNLMGITTNAVTTQTIADVNVTYDILNNLAFNTSFSTQILNNEEKTRSKDYTFNGFDKDGTGSARYENHRNYSFNNTLTYKNNWGDHSLTSVVGVTYQEDRMNIFSVSGQTFISNDLKNLSSAAEITGGTGTGTSFAFQNNLIRISYSFKDRYQLTAVGSYNGSSRFQKTNRYGFFPAIAGGWIISDEAFMNDIEWINFLKVRASFGITGNANIDNFLYNALLDGGANYLDEPGYSLSQLESQDLHWEKTAQTDIALEFGLLSNRVRGTMGYYFKNTSDLLFAVPVSATNGFSTQFRNFGSVLNRGLEFDLSLDVVRSVVDWSILANFATLHNEVTALPLEEITISGFDIGDRILRVGEPLDTYYMVEYAGVDPANGDALFYDKDGNKTSDYNQGARRLLGNPHPKFYGGFGTTLGYKGLQMGVNFIFNSGYKIYGASDHHISSSLGTSNFNQRATEYDYWTPQNARASIPEPRKVPNGNQISSRYLEDASFLRLQNLSLSYVLPTSLIQNYRVQIFAQGTNLFQITKFTGMDPETINRDFPIPTSKAIEFGINLTF